ncbi:acyltransferase [Flavobacterium granuli]|uniref:Peptidoglycan/LPS O-acetylase OafA/YrhL n=1 Tax=Flavobacterium granuli TaxID=280093 RepID=A0ABU1S5X9_9FLAO|nr:acyltransferase [Flavobacterium granuli]MDR6846422.1 peptidoglycan/LPS O-acetylase OafA/YrhL [Flavobacterium granuli]
MRIEQLTFTRFLAAVSVVVFHYGKKSFLFNNDIVSFIFSNGNVCVSYFFILSGFVMIIAYGNNAVISVSDYFINRFSRIYPLYFFGILLIFFLQLRTYNVDILGLFLNIFMIQAWVPSKVLSVNSPGWSLSVELLFYIIFPLMFNKFYKISSLKKVSFFIIIFWVLSQVFLHLQFEFYGGFELDTIKNMLNYNPLMHFNEFLIGNVAGLFFIKNLQEKKGNYDFAILLFVGLVLLALKFRFGLNFHNGLFAVFFIPLIILFSLNNGFITKLFQKKIFVFLGEISFGIYILQYPVYSWVSAYSINKYFHINDVTSLFFIRLVMLLLVSSLSYVYIEKPIQNIIKNKKKIIVFF